MKYSIFFFLLFISNCFSQNNNDLKSFTTPQYQDNKKTDSIHTMKTIASGKTGLIRSNNKKIFVDVFDDRLLRSDWNEIAFKKKERIIGQLQYDDGIMVFTESLPEKDQRVLHSHIINLNTNKIESIDLSTREIDKKLTLFSNIKDATFAKSPDKSKYAVLTYTIHKNEIYYIISVFNSADNSLIFENSISKNDNKFMLFSQIELTNSGIVYTLEESFYDPDQPKTKNPDNRTMVLSKFEKDSFESLNIDDKDYFMSSAKIVNQENMISINGLYAAQTKNKKILGTAAISIEKETFKVKDEIYTPFPKEIYEDILSARKLKRKDNDELYLRDYKVNEIIIDENNNKYLVAEESYYFDNSLFYTLQTMAIVAFYDKRISYWEFDKFSKNDGYLTPHFDNLLILKFDSNNQLIWGRSILKEETEQSTYNVILKDDVLHVILNSGRNLKEYKDERVKVKKGVFERSSLYDYYFTSDGEAFINKIQDNSFDSLFLPKYGSYTNERFIMMSDHKNKRSFMVLE